MTSTGAENIAELLTAMQVEATENNSKIMTGGDKKGTNVPSQNGKLSFDSDEYLSEDESDTYAQRSVTYP